MSRTALVNDKVFVELYRKSNDRVGLINLLKKFKTFKDHSDGEIAAYASIRAHHLRNKKKVDLPRFKRGRKASLL